MAEEITITLPKLGESIVSATVVQWFKKVGDFVALDEPLLEVSTDKVNSEIPSPAPGILKQILAEPNQEIQVGKPLAILSTSAKVEARKETPLSTQCPAAKGEANDFLSPSVTRLLKEKGIPLEEIDRIPRTGEGNRLTKKDVEDYASKPRVEAPATERIPMNAMRKAIAENMVRSFYEAPHASLITEVDVTRLMQTIQEYKTSFLEKHGAKLTVTAFVARAIARALKAFPLLNASLEGGHTILVKRFVNLGIAVSVDQSVIVPVIRNCQELSLAQIAKEIADKAEKARTHKLDLAEVKDGTITLTNFGMTGTMIGVPIIRYPEVAIVGMGAITKKVAAMPDDSMAIRSVMWVSLTFDHRVLDGLYGCAFLKELKTHLEDDITLE